MVERPRLGRELPSSLWVPVQTAAREAGTKAYADNRVPVVRAMREGLLVRPGGAHSFFARGPALEQTRRISRVAGRRFHRGLMS